MSTLYAYSLAPVVSIALLLFFSAALHGRRGRGLAAWCLSIAVWSGALLLGQIPATAEVGRHLAASGALIAGGFLHAAYDFTEQRDYRLVWLAYVAGFGLMLTGVAVPGVLYDPTSLEAGPMFGVGMAAAVVAATIPLVALARAWRDAGGPRRRQLFTLGAAGALSYFGGWANAMSMSQGHRTPYGLYAVLAGLVLLARVVRDDQAPAARRLLDRSLLYSGLAALLSAGFLLGVLVLVEGAGGRGVGLSVAFFVFLAALAVEPLRQRVQESIGGALAPDRARAPELARELGRVEQRADHAERLAELGTLVSAVAHEVRNPLGVLGAHVRILERSGASAETVAGMQEQIQRASRFVDDLLSYGRPRALSLRMLDLGAIVELAWSMARGGFGPDVPDARLEVDVGAPPPLIEADQSQLTDALVVLFDNALAAIHGQGAAPGEAVVRVHGRRSERSTTLTISDSGSGIGDAVRDRVFEPFVTGRKREGPRPGTGLGLAIARRVVERHHGTLTLTAPGGGDGDGDGGEPARRAPLSGASFTLELPNHQPVLGAAASTEEARP